jgi:dihydroxyacetone kinase-like protein
MNTEKHASRIPDPGIRIKTDQHMAVNRQDVLRWLDELQRVFAENRQQLTDLDSAVGDGDFGISLDRGFTAVQAALTANPPADIRAVFQSVASVLIKTMGGSSGPLLGTFFLRAATACADKSELAPADVVALFQAGVEGLQQRGKAALGDKTMMDAWLPAVDAMRSALEAGSGLTEILESGAAAAEAGMRATTNMQARKGRGSYLGERSVGHQDPGATATYLLFKAAAEVWRP